MPIQFKNRSANTSVLAAAAGEEYIAVIDFEQDGTISGITPEPSSPNTIVLGQQGEIEAYKLKCTIQGIDYNALTNRYSAQIYATDSGLSWIAQETNQGIIFTIPEELMRQAGICDLVLVLKEITPGTTPENTIQENEWWTSEVFHGIIQESLFDYYKLIDDSEIINIESISDAATNAIEKPLIPLTWDDTVILEKTSLKTPKDTILGYTQDSFITQLEVINSSLSASDNIYLFILNSQTPIKIGELQRGYKHKLTNNKTWLTSEITDYAGLCLLQVYVERKSGSSIIYRRISPICQLEVKNNLLLPNMQLADSELKPLDDKLKNILLGASPKPERYVLKYAGPEIDNRLSLYYEPCIPIRDGKLIDYSYNILNEQNDISLTVPSYDITSYRLKYTGQQIDNLLDKVNNGTAEEIKRGSLTSIDFKELTPYSIIIMHGYKSGIACPNQSTFVFLTDQIAKSQRIWDAGKQQYIQQNPDGCISFFIPANWPSVSYQVFFKLEDTLYQNKPDNIWKLIWWAKPYPNYDSSNDHQFIITKVEGIK